MNFDFLVFPSPKCSYTKAKLGNELIFIPKYKNDSSLITEQKEFLSFKNPTPYFSRQLSNPTSLQDFFTKFNKRNKRPEAPLSSKTTQNSSLQSPRQINVKLEMVNSLIDMNKKRDDDEPQTPRMNVETEGANKKTQNGENLLKFQKKQLFLKDLALNEQKKSFFLTNKNDFDEGIDFNCVSSPKKILEYSFNGPQTKGNPFQTNSPRTFTAKYKARTHYFGNSPILKPPNPKTSRISDVETIERLIPCLLLESETPLDKILVYFHGNAEDIYLAYELLYYIEKYLRVRILAVEYPGYGVYTTHKPKSEIIQEDAIAVYDYLVKKVGFQEKDIILLGRSIGSGPASYLASQRNPGALIMMSPFISLRSVVKDHVGGLHNILKERFNNIENVKKVKCPCFFIHGLQDKLISYQHSQKLHDACGGPSELCLPKEMTHSEFCFDSDFIVPLEKFLRNYGFNFFDDDDESNSKKLKFPPEVYKAPVK